MHTVDMSTDYKCQMTFRYNFKPFEMDMVSITIILVWHCNCTPEIIFLN